MESPVNRLAALAIAVFFLAPVAVGLLNREVMIGDEITHYYTLATQCERLPHINIEAHIPTASGEEVRHYPHVMAWHYLGAVVSSLLGGASVGLVQVYHSIFWLQLLVAGWTLAKYESGGKGPSPLWYVLLIGSIPVALLLSVAFYQDIPAVAQALTAFALLRRRKFTLSVLFLLISLCMKETSFVLLPPFVLAAILTYRPWAERGEWWRLAARLAVFAVLVAGLVFAWEYAMRSVRSSFYPLDQLRALVVKCSPSGNAEPAVQTETATAPQVVAATVRMPRPEIATNPGDLRRPVNFLVFGGGILWVALAGSLAALYARFRLQEPDRHSVSWWALPCGLLYIAVTAVHMRTAPDARFFIPGVVILLLPAAQLLAGFFTSKIWLRLLVCAALLQSSAVLYKTWELRHVPEGVISAIDYFRANPPPFNRVFMYPEGNYRLFTCEHDWYMEYALKDFWRGDQNVRLAMLKDRKIGAVVIKRHLVGQIDPEMNNLGVYPVQFVSDLEKDSRFRKVMENGDVMIFLVDGDSAK